MFSIFHLNIFFLDGLFPILTTFMVTISLIFYERTTFSTRWNNARERITRTLLAISTALVKSYSRCWAVMNNFQNLSSPRRRKFHSFFLASSNDPSPPLFFYRALSLCSHRHNSSASLSITLLHPSFLHQYFLIFFFPRTNYLFSRAKHATNICFQKWTLREIEIW